jgi:plastocyanin
VALGLLLSSCGDDDDSAQDGGETTNPIPSVAGPRQQPVPAQSLAAEQVQPAGGVIEIATINSLFASNNLLVPVGESVTIRVTNEDAAQHNLRIAGIDGQYDTEDDAVTSPDALNQGDVGELEFAPPVSGVYSFRCDFHPGSMGGQIVAGEATPAPGP